MHPYLISGNNVIDNTFDNSKGNGLMSAASPQNTVAPVASGFVIVGQTLSVTEGTWTGANSFTYQWKRNGVNISGATSSTYTAVLADEGQYIQCVVSSGGVSATSNSLSNFSLADLTPEFYLEPADASTISLNGATQVAQIDDKSGNGNHFVQSVSSDQPEYGTRTLNGLPCLDFALGNYLVKENYSRPISGDVAFFMVAELDSLTGAAAALIAAVLNIGGEGNFQYDAISTLYFRGRFNSSNMGASPIVNPINESNSNLTLHNVNIKSSQDLASINIGADPNKSLSGEMTGDLSTDVNLLVFCNRAINQFIDGAMGLFLGVEDVTDATREKIEWYCFKRFGLTLPSGHPYKTIAPPSESFAIQTESGDSISTENGEIIEYEGY